jgi:hypothetical protein
MLQCQPSDVGFSFIFFRFFFSLKISVGRSKNLNAVNHEHQDTQNEK